MTTFTVAMLAASPRKQSINVKLGRAIERCAPDNLRFIWVRMDDMPFYNGDLESDRPASVNAFTDAIRAADAGCCVMPEYNRSLPAGLKNAIDWGSKPMDANVWRDKVIAITGTSPGAIGTAVGQQHLRQILAILGAHVVPGEAYISFKTPDMIDDEGNIADESVRDFVTAFAARFAGLVAKLA